MKRLIIAALVSGCCSSLAIAAEKTPAKAYPVYWMSISTQNQSIPGMTAEAGGMMSMFGGGAAFGPRREMNLQLVSPKQSQQPEAFHDIPASLKMGKSLPLITPKSEKAPVESQREYGERTEKMEKPKLRMLVYWGCSEEVGKGQPRVIDTEKMSMEAFGRAMTSRGPSPQYPPSPRSGWTYGDWPNRENNEKIPKEASLVGEHLIRGNYLNEIRFSLDSRRDFMAPVELSTTGSPQENLKVSWKGIPTATAYLATAMAHNQKNGEMIFWSSSEVQDLGTGLMTYLSNGDVQRFLKERVLMGPDRTACTIPKGIFKDTEGTMLQFIAYGDELNLAYPPKPKDPKQPWNPQWSVKVRLKSTGMSPLMAAEDSGGSKRTKKGKSRKEEPVEEQQAEEKPSKGGGFVDGFKGMFGF